MRRALPVLAALLLAGAPDAAGAPYVPAPGKVALGLAGRPDESAFVRGTGRSPAVFQTFLAWGHNFDYAFAAAHKLRAATMLHLSTNRGPGTPERLTPRQIARGAGDRWLARLNAAIAREPKPVYVRPLAEMNGYWNPYSAYGPGGRRDAAHSTRWFRRAFRRIALILRGGPDVDARLRALRLPPTRRALRAARVAIVWCPQVAGAPDVSGNAPRAYWPGGAYVDWAATDFYSKFPNFRGLNRFYRGGPWRRKPFAFAEWAIWDRDDPVFVRRLLAWVRRHRRTHLLVYNQGYRAGGPLDLARYPGAAAALRHGVASLPIF